MDNKDKAKWIFFDKEKERLIDALTEELPLLRAKAGVPQDDLARLIGISRQTYGTIERKERLMSWSTYLSLILFFDYNQSTHEMIRNLSAFPSGLINRINDKDINEEINIESIIELPVENIKNILDKQALHAIKTVFMIEYARCNNLSGEAVVKSFDGRTFSGDVSKGKIKVKKALKSIKENGDTKI